MASMQQQPNGVNCSVFVIAFAVDILHGFAEMEKRFVVETMRSHLLNYFREAKAKTHQVVKVAYYLRSFNCIGAHSLKKIWREMKIFLWQNVLNVLNSTTKCLRIPSRVFTNESVEWKCTRC